MNGITTGRAGHREWIGLAVLTLPAMLISIDLTVLHLAVPSLSADLAPTGTQLLWIIDIYGFLVAGSLITIGLAILAVLWLSHVRAGVNSAEDANPESTGWAAGQADAA